MTIMSGRCRMGWRWWFDVINDNSINKYLSFKINLNNTRQSYSKLDSEIIIDMRNYDQSDWQM